MSNEFVLTPEGHEKLRNELIELKGPTRGRIAEAIKEAKSHGDLKENAAYHEAKLNQARLESRIADLERALQLARIVARSDGTGDSALLGSKVTLIDLDFDDEFVITLVGSYESDPAKDLISIVSPLGAGILGRVAGDEVEVEAPAGKQRYRIKAIA